MSEQSKYAGRSGHAWRETLKWFKANVPWICMRCGGDIPKDVHHGRDKLGYTLDHKIPLTQILRDKLDPYDKANLQPMHRRCNSSKGIQDGEEDVVVSRQW